MSTMEATAEPSTLKNKLPRDKIVLKARDIPDKKILLKIGKEEVEFLVDKSLIANIPPFAGMFSAGNQFIESRAHTLNLPEDDENLWLLAIEFLTLKEYFPYLCTKKNPETLLVQVVDWDTNYPYWLQHDRALGSGYRKKECLTTPLHIINDYDKIVEYEVDAVRIGKWTTSLKTHQIFKQIVQLYVLAEKYVWSELMDICLRKITAFPLGGREFSVLVEYCTMQDVRLDTKNNKSENKVSLSFSWSATEDVVDIVRKMTVQELLDGEAAVTSGRNKEFGAVSNVRNQMRGVLDDLFAFHTAYYDQSRIIKSSHIQERLPTEWVDHYRSLDHFLEYSMTPEAWIVVKKMTRVRNDRMRVLGEKYVTQGESCIEKRDGILEVDWTPWQAEARHVQWMQHSGNWKRKLTSWNWAQGSVQFTESRRGDYISAIQLHSTIRPFVYGINQRTQKLGCFDPQTLGFSAQHDADVLKHDMNPCSKCQSGLQLIQGAW